MADFESKLTGQQFNTGYYFLAHHAENTTHFRLHPQIGLVREPTPDSAWRARIQRSRIEPNITGKKFNELIQDDILIYLYISA